MIKINEYEQDQIKKYENIKNIGIHGIFMNTHHKQNSFIEQYICAVYNTFYYLNL